MIGKWEREEGKTIKMDIKNMLNVVLKNRILIFCCAVLIGGNVFGTCVLKILPTEVCKNLFIIISHNEGGFISEFMNRFCFPAIIITAVYFAGFSIFGRFSALFSVFTYGIYYSFINGINYMFCGAEYFVKNVISYFSLLLYFGFFLILMSENAFYSSKILSDSVKTQNAEKPHFKAKNLTVKYISFTVIFAVFSAFSSYISIILQPVL